MNERQFTATIWPGAPSSPPRAAILPQAESLVPGSPVKLDILRIILEVRAHVACVTVHAHSCYGSTPSLIWLLLTSLAALRCNSSSPTLPCWYGAVMAPLPLAPLPSLTWSLSLSWSVVLGLNGVSQLCGQRTAVDDLRGLLQLLLERGADPTALTERGMNALHYAVVSGCKPLLVETYRACERAHKPGSLGQHPLLVADKDGSLCPLFSPC